MSSFLMPLPAGEDPDIFSGVVEPDEQLAGLYFVQALHRGYNPQTKQFDNVKEA